MPLPWPPAAPRRDDVDQSRPVESYFSPIIRDLAPYEPPDWEGLARRAGLEVAQLVRLDANENPYPLSPRAVEALARFEGYGFYPDYRALEQAVAAYAGVSPESVALGNGGDEIIDLAVRLFVPPGSPAIVCPPAFSMYSVSLVAHGRRVLAVPRRDNWALDVEGIENLAVREGARLLFVTSPGNPDGQPVPHDVIRRLLALPLVVILDEAYVEFGGESAVPLLAEHPNLVLLRTFSKWAGMAGLRLGYALACPEVIAALHGLRPPYNVNAAAAVAALATLQDPGYAASTLGALVAERERLTAVLGSLPGVKVLPGQANFLLCHLEGRAGSKVADALAQRGVLVRSFGPWAAPGYGEGVAAGPSLDDAIRVTVGRPEQNDAFIAALCACLDLPPPIVQAPANDLPPRSARVQRQTRETEVSVGLVLDGTGHYEVETGIGFLDHMLAQIAAHGLLDLTVRARGDLEVDEHHTVEDVAIVLGQALDKALGDRRGLVRIAHAYAPLDETLARVVIDLSGRPYAVVEARFDASRLGTMAGDLVVHFFETLAVHARLSLHAGLLYGRNDHHRAEALFKALGRALGAASRCDDRRQGIPSTKGVL
jgi:histidinol-phosphate aminotransferase